MQKIIETAEGLQNVLCYSRVYKPAKYKISVKIGPVVLDDFMTDSQNLFFIIV